MKTHALFSSKLVKLIVMLLCVIMAFGVVACGGGRTELDPNKVQISIQAANDGYGVRALKEQAKRFNAIYENGKTYTDPTTGKVYTGAHMEIYDASTRPGPGSGWEQDTYTMYNATTEFSSVEAAVRNGYAANIDYILRKTIPGEDKSIADKFYPESKYYYGVPSEENEDGYELCGIPFAQDVSGIMYDKDLFDTGYYIASPSAENVKRVVNSKIFPNNAGFSNQIRLVDKNGQKSVGPNGIEGDYDDGLPSSMVEFIILCEELANKGFPPLAYPGEYPSYLSLGLSAIYYSLLGHENAKSMISFESNGLNLVTGFTTDDLFRQTYEGASGAKVPVVAQNIPMEESSGYYHTWTLERYWTLAFGQLVVGNTKWESYSTKMNRSHHETHRDFIFGIEDDASERRAAMMVEGSYWYNEAVDANSFLQYEAKYGKTADERGIAWMSLPVNIYASVTGEDKTVTINGLTESVKGEPQTLDNVGDGALLVNANVADKPHVMEAIEDYLMFAFSDEGLNRFAKDAGYTAALKWEYDEEIMADAPKYIQDTFTVFGDSNIVSMFSETKSWRDRADYTFVHSYDSYFFKDKATPKKDASVKFIRTNGATEAFKKTMILMGSSGTGWWQYYKGQGDVDPPTQSTYPGTNTPVVFN